jgi:hypothetical protein
MPGEPIVLTATTAWRCETAADRETDGAGLFENAPSKLERLTLMLPTCDFHMMEAHTMTNLRRSDRSAAMCPDFTRGAEGELSTSGGRWRDE